MAEPNNPEFQMFKGLQRPLEFLGLQGRYIVWAAITAGISLLGFIITYTLLGFMVGLIVLVIAVSTGVGIIMIKHRKRIQKVFLFMPTVSDFKTFSKLRK